MSLSLYQLTGQLLEVQNALLEMEGLDDETIQNTLAGYEAPLEDKAIGYVMVMRNFEASAKAIKEQEDALAKRRKALEAKVERLKKNLLDNLLAADKLKIDRPEAVITIAKSPGKVEVRDEAQIPADYYDTPPPVLNRRAIAEAISAGAVVPGAELVPGWSLRIK